MGVRDRPGRLRWVAPIAIGLLFVATVGAFGWSQRLKREPLVIDRVEFIAQGLRNAEDPHKPTVFSPNGDCRRDNMSINFRTTKSDDATVEIIGPGGQAIRTLVENRFFKRYREHTLWWNGKKNNGRVPKTERYRVRVTMKGLDRVLYLPGRIRLRNYEPLSSKCGPDGKVLIEEPDGRGSPDGPKAGQQ